ncbi:MAG: signal peptidase II [Candidatus Peregrinibacteria bacterium]|nr:signal peptidase II [Candidatus Peregrinibacteria bacterium]
MNHQKLNHLFFAVGIIDVLLLDQLSKWWAGGSYYQPFAIVEGFFYLKAPQMNDGIAFGIDVPFWLQIAGSLLILAFLFQLGREQIFAKSKRSLLASWSLGLVIGGGLGNLVDRVLHREVLDFIVLRPFPVLNVADVGITVGLVLLFATILIDQRKLET